MDEDKIDKTIEIILQNQAQFYADMQKTQELQNRSEKRIENLEKVASLTLESIKQTNESLGELTIKVDRIADKVDNLTGKVEKLADAQIETDERLNAVILMAEKYFSNQNGKNN